MASLTRSSPYGVALLDFTVAILLAVFFVFIFRVKRIENLPFVRNVYPFLSFGYSCFFKPHTGDGSGNQQDALESFYKVQAAGYDATRARLLCGREDMLALVAGQLMQRAKTGVLRCKPVWVDVCLDYRLRSSLIMLDRRWDGLEH